MGRLTVAVENLTLQMREYRDAKIVQDAKIDRLEKFMWTVTPIMILAVTLLKDVILKMLFK